ncbi:MAG: hypothetical protein HY293_02370 [Planctomycetes bacterium]|nr:hypothetical protein [Planctomycetota bacterium]
MGTGSIVLFFSLAAGVVALAIILSISATLGMNHAVRKLALRLGAAFEEGGLFDEPRMEFTLGGCQAWLQVSSGGRSSLPFSRVVVNVRHRSVGSMHVERTSFRQSFLRRYGPPYVSVGDPDFDRDFVMTSVPPSIAARVFAPSRRTLAIASFLRLRGLDAPMLDLDDEHLTVQVQDYVSDEASLMELVKAAEEFLSYLLDSAGIPGIALEEVRILEGGDCQVCGGTLQGDLVRCPSCGTPHHHECWQYLGRCSTYACKGKRVVA